MVDSAILVIALSVLVYGLFSGRLERSILTPPAVFIAIGLAVGPSGVGIIKGDLANSPLFHLLAELTLIMVLFTDAARIDLKLLRSQYRLPLRMLSVGLPLTITTGAFVAMTIFPEWGVWPCALIAAILAPTDAALGQAVVINERVPVRIRQALNVESGLNDGICLPPVLLFLALTGVGHDAGESSGAAYWGIFVATQILIAPCIGVAVGWVGGKLITKVSGLGWMNHSFQDLGSLGLAFLAYAIAEMIGSNGFIAVFIAGMAVGNTSRQICACLYDFGEAEGQLLSLLLFMGFGAVYLPEAVAATDAMGWVYAVLSLTVIRMAPVIVSLIGAKLKWETYLFLSWFGPRGVASLVYGLLMLEHAGPEFANLLHIVVITVAMSAIAHGVTAYPVSIWYGNRLTKHREARDLGEDIHAHEIRTRLRGAHTR